MRPAVMLSAALAVVAALPGAAHAVPVGLPCDAGAFPGLARSAALTEPGVKVCSATELDDLLRSTYSGRVVVPADVSWDMRGRDGAPLQDIPLKSGVQLVGERGALGSRPTLFTDAQAPRRTLFLVTGNDVVVQGLHLRGPQPPAEHANQTPYVDAITVVEDAEQGLGRRVTITENELDRWSGAGVNAVGAHGNLTLDRWDPAWSHLEAADASLVAIRANFLHDNLRDSGGYGVVVNGGAFASIEGNVFDTNRHAVAASGKAYSGYVARFNYVLHGAVKEGGYYNQHFDVHGTGDGGYGGPAGDYFEVSHNTIRGEQGYYVVKTRPSLMVRGTPTHGVWFNDNVDVHDDLDSAVALNGGGDSGIGEDHERFDFHAAGNRFDTDYSTETAVGDFDGDGRTDVFVANGTAWYFSRGGVGPWEYLHASDKRTRDLAFADIDGDGVTDVLYRDAAGRVGWLRSGREALVPLTTSTVALGDVRVGDFDGDGRDDLFVTDHGRWSIWSGATRAWSAAQTSTAAIGDLLFGAFDAVPGTDVVAVRNGAWSYSSGARTRWQRLNAKLTGDFHQAVAADLDGDGTSDIAVERSDRWESSAGGRGPLLTIRHETGPAPLNRLMLGRFDGGPRVQAVAWAGDWLVLWGATVGDPHFRKRSAQEMR